VYIFSPTGDLVGLNVHTGERVWSDHVGTRQSKNPGLDPEPQLLLYGDALIAHSGGQLFSLLPQTDG
jgi:hypothetical protein